MEKWTEIRSAYLVAKLGTVSEAANVLGVHRATVNRHIDALEQMFGAKLFQRHARGYTPTDEGRDMLETAGRVEEMFESLLGRSQGRSSQLSGELIVTALSGVAPLVMPAMAEFRLAYPNVELEFMVDSKLARLEYGEAHVAIRAGPKPEEADYVVLPFREIRFGLYAHHNYIERYGKPDGLNDLDKHWFVGSLADNMPIPFLKWMRNHISTDKLALRVQHPLAILHAVMAGIGLGFLAEQEAATYDELVQVAAPEDEWSVQLWIVTHVDLHRTVKVQKFLKRLRDRN